MTVGRAPFFLELLFFSHPLVPLCPSITVISWRDEKFSVFVSPTFYFSRGPPTTTNSPASRTQSMYLKRTGNIAKLLYVYLYYHTFRGYFHYTIMDIDKALLTRAVEAIIRYEKKKSSTKNANALFEDFDKPILLSVQLTAPITKAVDRPVRVKVPHSLYADDGSNSLCIFCRTDDKAEFETLLAEKRIPGLTTVLSMKEVKRDYKAITDRKKLLTAHTHFLCDPSIMTQLYNSLGTTFSRRNKYPVPMKKFASFDKVPTRAMDALNSTYMHLRGDVISIRMAHSGMTVQEVVDNVSAGLLFACEKLPDNWRSIHSLHLKSADSAALPIYSKAKNDYVSYAKGLAGIEEKPKSKKALKGAAARVAPVAEKKTVAPVAEKKTPVKAIAQPEPEPVVEESAPKGKKTPAKAKTPKAKTPAAQPEPELVVEEEPVVEATPKGKKTPVKKAKAVVEEPSPAVKSVKKATRGKVAALEPVPEDAVIKPARTTRVKRAAEPVEEVSAAEEEPITKRLRRGRSESR